jgi:LacI family transcriptional regulator
MACNCCVESKRITLRDIALKAGVNRATVSRALRAHPSLPTATCERIKEIALQLGYISNPLISKVMSNARSTGTAYLGTLAYVTAWPDQNWRHSNPIDVRYFNGALHQATQSAYSLEEFSLKEKNISARRITQILQSRGIKGLILAPLPESTIRNYVSLDWSIFSSIAIGYTVRRPPLDRVASHYSDNLAMAMHQIRQSGYSRVGLALLKGVDERLDHNLLASFRIIQERMRRLGSLRPLVFGVDDFKQFKDWVSANKPDVVISFGGPAFAWLCEMGIPIPGQIGFVELDLPKSTGAIAGIDQCPETVAQVAVDLLVSQLYRNEHGLPPLPKLMLIKGRWMNGSTLPKKAECSRS